MLTPKGNNWLFINRNCYICEVEKSTEIGLCDLCLADLNLPTYPCPLCAMPRTGRQTQCTYCFGKPQAFDSAWTALTYQFPINAIFAQIKQGKNPSALHWMGRLMADYLPALNAEFSYTLVPVPMHPVDQLKRGFNQTEILVHPLARKLGSRLDSRLISKTARTAHQAELSRSARLSNLKGSFRLNRAEIPERVILVDDVMTTGATAHTIASLLKSQGVLEVKLWAFCRAL